MQRKNKIAYIIMATVFTGFMISFFLHSKWEYQGEYNFEIKRIKVTPGKYLVFYDNLGEKISLQNYIINDREGVRVGDFIRKAACAEVLYVFRKDSTGKAIVILEVRPASMFPRGWFCN